MKLLVLAAATAMSLATLSSTASATVFATESFESPVLNTPGIQYGPDEFAFNTNEVGPVVIPGFTFRGFSGIISNGSLGVFPNTPFGNQAAFLQSYQGVGSEIDWSLTGLVVGRTYTLSFIDVASLIVPAEPFTVSAVGGPITPYAPTGAYTTQTYSFTPTSSSESIDFTASVLAGNQASAIDGFSLSAVPEPFAWFLMIAGFGVMGVALRYNRRNGVTLAA